MGMDPLFIFIVGAIALFLVVGIFGNWQLAGRIHHLKNSLLQYASKQSEWDRSLPTNAMIGDMIEEYKTQRIAGIEQINTQALIERHYNQITIRVLGIFPVTAGGWERFNTFLNASMIMLGLLGTFIGLTYALFGMQTVLSGFGSEGNLSVANIVTAISQPFDGMSVAFVTSICGIGASLVLSLFTSGLLGSYIGPNTNQLRSELLIECEDFLDNRYLLFVEMQKPKGSMEELMERLAQNIKESFDHSVVAFGNSIIATTERIDDSIVGINQMVERQNKIVVVYEQGSTQLVKFGVAMEKTVQTLVANHKDTAAQMENLGQQVERLNVAIALLGDKTADSSRSLETVIRSSNQMLEEERKNSEKIVHLFGERWSHIGEAQRALIESIGTIQKQMEEMVRSSMMHMQQHGTELSARTKEQWDSVMAKIDSILTQNNRTIIQSLQQTYTELGRAIRQQEEIGQKNIESHRFLIEKLPSLARTAEEFSRSIDTMERHQSDFLERFRREISSLMSQSQDRERHTYTTNEPSRELRELARELEAIRAMLEREFRESHRFTSDIAHFVESIYDTGRSTMRRGEAQVIDSRSYTPARNDRHDNGRSKEEGYRR